VGLLFSTSVSFNLLTSQNAFQQNGFVYATSRRLFPNVALGFDYAIFNPTTSVYVANEIFCP